MIRSGASGGFLVGYMKLGVRMRRDRDSRLRAALTIRNCYDDFKKCFENRPTFALNIWSDVDYQHDILTVAAGAIEA